ncbi:MAG: DUF362 domain-containing protein [Thermodesulfobacteriota bacterium]
MKQRKEGSALKSVAFTSYAESVPAALSAVGAEKLFAQNRPILIKPNLVTDVPHPVTTHPDCCEAVVLFARMAGARDIIIAEGSGDPNQSTMEIFRKLGYFSLAERHNVRLVDLNEEPCETREIPSLRVFPTMHLPAVARERFIVSVPVLKAHSLACMTGTLKNMMGFAPPSHYAGRYGVWKKAAFHEDMHEAIRDLNRYVTPGLTLLDASVGLCTYHLGGPRCRPPVARILAGTDPLAVDREAARLLGLDWRSIDHLRD